MQINHAFTSGKSDGADGTLVQPSNWNAALVTSMSTAKLLGRTTAASGPIEELTIPLGAALGGTGAANNVANVITFSGNYALTLTLGGATSLALPTSGTLAALGGTNTWTGANTFSNVVLPQTDDGTTSSGTVTLSASANYSHKLTNGGAFTLAFSGWATTGNLSTVEIQLINGAAFTITWPTINWLKGDGTKSTTFSSMGVTLQASGVNVIIVWTTDGGTTLYGRAM